MTMLNSGPGTLLSRGWGKAPISENFVAQSIAHLIEIQSFSVEGSTKCAIKCRANMALGQALSRVVNPGTKTAAKELYYLDPDI